MKALAVDSAVSRLTIAAKNDDKVCIAIYDIGMKQSETLVNAIDYVLSKVEITAAELDYTTVCAGPGSFTGLRLGYSALKAIELANNVPVYAIPSLKAYSAAYDDFGIPVLSGINANKDRFYAALTSGSNYLLEDGDYEYSQIVAEVNKHEKVFVCGPDTEDFCNILMENGCNSKLIRAKTNAPAVEMMFRIAEEKIEKGEKPMEDYDGPVYLRASEAEIKLNEKNA